MKNFVKPGLVVTAVAPSGGCVSGNLYRILFYLVLPIGEYYYDRKNCKKRYCYTGLL